MSMDSLFSDEIVRWLDDVTSDETIDSLFTAAVEAYESSQSNVEVESSSTSAGVGLDHTSCCDSPASPTPAPAPPASSSDIRPAAIRRPFAPAKTDKEVKSARTQGIPKRTQDDTKYCVSLWNAWKSYRKETTGDIIEDITELSISALNHWLTSFILEVRKKDGSEFPPSSLYHICCGLMRHLRWNGQPSIDFFSDGDFADFKASLDAEMKRLQSKGLGSKKRQAEVLSESEEELLWQKKLLGDSTLQTLLDSMVFYNGLYFALRSGKEHRNLRSRPCQIELVERPGEKAFLRYTEDVSKNRQGGLKYKS